MRASSVATGSTRVDVRVIVAQNRLPATTSPAQTQAATMAPPMAAASPAAAPAREVRVPLRSYVERQKTVGFLASLLERLRKRLDSQNSGRFLN